MDNKTWFREAKFGMMVHFGLYSLLAGEWKGKEIPRLGEWIRLNARIPMEEYHKLAKAFNPIFFDAEEWVLTAKSAGMKYIVVTAKHHEGFCLFHSEYDDFNAVDGTPFGRDLIAELAAACRKHDMKLGLYYSQELDWNERDGGGYKYGTKNGHVSNDWDFPEEADKDFDRCFRAKTLPQVRELLTNYGELLLIWFDTPNVITEAQSRELFDLVKELQPNCLVNTRIGNGLGDYRSLDDNVIPDEYDSDILTETPATLNHTWGFKYCDRDYKTPEEVLRLKKHLNDRGINYLLNVGPDALGRIPAPAVEIFREVGRQNEDANA